MNNQNRAYRRALVATERKAAKSGDWGDWRYTELPNGVPGGAGWCAKVRHAYGNNLYAVMVRPVATPFGTVMHCSIRTASQLEPPWRDLQRIKNELFGRERLAVQVCPAESKLVDEADMYHLWVYPEGHTFPFGLKDEERKP